MIFKQDIKSTETNELNKAGRHIKVINAAAALRLRVFAADGSLMLDSEVRSGFELEMPAFAKATVSSDVNQSYEIWVSADKLGYNAPSANANNLTSYKAPHYGDTDLILPFEPSRLSARVVSDAPWWYGGANVDKENGIPVAAGEIAEIRGAAAISAAIGEQGEYLPKNEAVPVVSNNKYPYAVLRNDRGVIVKDSNGISMLTHQGWEDIPLVYSGNVMAACTVDNHSIAYTIFGKYYIFVFDIEKRTTKQIYFGGRNVRDEDYVDKIYDMVYVGGKYVCVATGYDDAASANLESLLIYDGVTWQHKQKRVGFAGKWAAQVLGYGDSEILTYKAGVGWQIMDINTLPDVDDRGTRLVISPALGGNQSYISYTKPDVSGYGLIQTTGTNSSAALVNANNDTITPLGGCSAAAISNAGIVLLEGSNFKISKDNGQSFITEPAPHTLGSSANQHMFYHGGLVWNVGSSFTGYYVTEKVRVTPKQSFRVLKAFS